MGIGSSRHVDDLEDRISPPPHQLVHFFVSPFQSDGAVSLWLVQLHQVSLHTPVDQLFFLEHQTTFFIMQYSRLMVHGRVRCLLNYLVSLSMKASSTMYRIVISWKVTVNVSIHCHFNPVNFTAKNAPLDLRQMITYLSIILLKTSTFGCQCIKHHSVQQALFQCVFSHSAVFTQTVWQVGLQFCWKGRS